MSRLGPGAFIAVTGASGVGKDSLLRYAAEALADLHLVRRLITRPRSGGEEHEPIEVAAFDAAEAAGEFAVSWRAHGLAYGIPRSVDALIADARPVIANISRAALPQLAERYQRLRVVRVTLSPEVRAARLAARGREAEADIAARLTRADPAPDFPIDLTISNDTALAVGGEKLSEFIRNLT